MFEFSIEHNFSLAIEKKMNKFENSLMFSFSSFTFTHTNFTSGEVNPMKYLTDKEEKILF